MQSRERLTVKNGAGEEHQKFDEEVLLLGGDLVPAESFSTLLHLCITDALLDVDIQPLFGHDHIIRIVTCTRRSGFPELLRQRLTFSVRRRLHGDGLAHLPRLLALLGFGASPLGRGDIFRVTIGRNIFLQCRILV